MTAKEPGSNPRFLFALTEPHKRARERHGKYCRRPKVLHAAHSTSLTMRARVGMCSEALAGITGVLNGEKPCNVVNPKVLW